MKQSRRAFFCGAVSGTALAASLFRPSTGWTQSIFDYDALGRLIKVTLGDGTTIYYRYDAAGNRTEVESTTIPLPPEPFVATLHVVGSTPINLRSLADAAGYTEDRPATITFIVTANSVIIGHPGAPHGGLAIDTGNWPTIAYVPALRLVVDGKVWGGGGAGGNGVYYNYKTPGEPGGNGGDALFCRGSFEITVNPGGEIKGGGGGGGSGSPYYWKKRLFVFEADNSSGAGGGFPNGPGGAATFGNWYSSPGASGTPSGGGLAGLGSGTVEAGRSGNGGNAGANGESGAHRTYAGGAGGAGGFAIRTNGHHVPIVNNGGISGGVG